MTKEELKQEAEVCMHNALFWLKLPISKENVEKGGSYILELLEPREKRITELEKACDETQELLDKQIEATYKVVEKLNKAKGIVKALLNVFVYDLAEDELDSADIVYMERAEEFLKEE